VPTDPPATQIRGIYATALTSLLRDLGIPIANPSPVVRERLNVTISSKTPAVQIRDRPDKQGVTLEGDVVAVRALVEILADALPRAVPRLAAKSETQWSLEFPSTIKQELDNRRRGMLPTVLLHHQLKTIDSDRMDAAEAKLARAPEQLHEVSAGLRSQMIDRHIRTGARLSVEHVKPAGQTYDLRGHVGAYDGRHLRLDRRFRPGGTYDSLDVPRLEGDYGRLDIEVGSGISVRRYFRADGTHLGDLYNLATEAELYPGRVRYLDLELDVLHMPGDEPRIVDQADLERAHARGYLSDVLVADAWALADQVLREIRVKSEK
jgi:probable ribonuclease FAU-1